MIKQSTFLYRVLKALKAAGWNLFSVDTEGVVTAFGSSVLGVMKECRAVDVCRINVKRHDDESASYLLIVWQGPDDRYPDGEEIISDYGMKLDSVISPLYDSVRS